MAKDMHKEVHRQPKGGVAPPQLCGIGSSSVRMAWLRPSGDLAGEEDPDLALLRREEALHKLLLRRFMHISERYLKGEL